MGSSSEVESRKAEGSAIEAEVRQVAEQMKSEITSATREYLTNLRGDTVKRFDTALAEIDRGIASAPTDDVRRDLSSKRAQIAEARAEALAKMDAALAQLG